MTNTLNLHEDRQVRMSLKIIYAIIASTALTVSTISGLYFKMENKNEMQDMQFQVLKLQVDKLEIDIKELQNKLDKKADRI